MPKKKSKNLSEGNPSYFAVIPADVRYDDRLSASEKLFFGEITALSRFNGYCWASNSYFSGLFKVRIETVSRWLKKLAKFDYIQIKYKHLANRKEKESEQFRESRRGIIPNYNKNNS